MSCRWGEGSKNRNFLNVLFWDEPSAAAKCSRFAKFVLRLPPDEASAKPFWISLHCPAAPGDPPALWAQSVSKSFRTLANSRTSFHQVPRSPLPMLLSPGSLLITKCAPSESAEALKGRRGLCLRPQSRDQQLELGKHAILLLGRQGFQSCWCLGQGRADWRGSGGRADCSWPWRRTLKVELHLLEEGQGLLHE